MIVSHTNDNNYPFISSCDLDLGTGNKLENGVFISAKLYPNAEPFNYAYISYIGRGSIIINTDADVELCQVIFEESSDGRILVGTAYQGSKVCGCICATHNLKPALNARYTPNKESFIFTPSVINPRPAVNAAYGLLSVDDKLITGIRFEGPTFITDADGTVSIDTESPVDEQERVVQTIKVRVAGNTVNLSGINVNIRSGKGCGVRVVSGTNGLVIGASKDV